jgi:opacity protein-like surface antigen
MSARLVHGLAAAALAFAVAAPAVHAQSTQTTGAQAPVVDVDRWNITAFLGPGFGADLNNSPLSVGVAGAYNFTSRLAIEGEFAYTRSAQQGLLFDLDTGVTSLSANAIYHFADTGWVPYGAVGIGMLRGSTNLEDLASLGLTGSQVIALGLDEDGSSTSLGLNFGGGVKRRVSDRVNFRGDLRYFSGDDLAPSFWRVYAGLGFLVGR